MLMVMKRALPLFLLVHVHNDLPAGVPPVLLSGDHVRGKPFHFLIAPAAARQLHFRSDTQLAANGACHIPPVVRVLVMAHKKTPKGYHRMPDGRLMKNGAHKKRKPASRKKRSY